MVINETKKPKHIKMVFFPDDYFIPGYTGYCPMYIFRSDGMTYGKATRELIKEFPRLKTRLVSLSHAIAQPHRKTKEDVEHGQGDSTCKSATPNVQPLTTEAKSSEAKQTLQLNRKKSNNGKNDKQYEKRKPPEIESSRISVHKENQKNEAEPMNGTRGQPKHQKATKKKKKKDGKYTEKELEQKSKEKPEKELKFSSPNSPVYMKPACNLQLLSLDTIPGYMGHIPGFQFTFGETFGTTFRKLEFQANRKRTSLKKKF